MQKWLATPILSDIFQALTLSSISITDPTCKRGLTEKWPQKMVVFQPENCAEKESSQINSL